MSKILITGPHLSSVSGISSFVKAIVDGIEGCDIYHAEIGRRSGVKRRLTQTVKQVHAFFLMLSSVDIAHINTSFQYPSLIRDLILVLLAKFRRKKIIVHMHGGAMCYCLKQHLVALCLFRALFYLSDYMLLLSPREVKSLGLIGCTKVYVVSNGVDSFCKKTTRRIEKSPLEIIYLGRLDVRKGLIDTIDAMRLAQENGLNVRLMLYGDGPDKSFLANRVNEFDLKNVFFGGVIRDDDKIQALKMSDVFLMPSYFEGMPFSLLEVMAFGVVPIVTDVGSMGDIVEDGVCGFIVPDKSPNAIVASLEKFLNEPEVLLTMSNKAFLNVERNFSIIKTKNDLAHVYATVFA